MGNEYEQSRAISPAAEVAHDHDTVEPGQSSRSALLRKSDHAVASGLVQRRARDANGVAEGAEHAVSVASSSSGSPLPDTLMRKFESSLGADLSGVRVHTGGDSERAADAVGAKAYTMGNDIHFGASHYDPSSSGGQHLLAHEVAHTVQQSGGAQRMQFKLEVSSPGDSLEHEADRAADAMVSGGAATVSGASGLSRQQNPALIPPVDTRGPRMVNTPGPGMIGLRHISKSRDLNTVTNIVSLIARYPAERGEILESVERELGESFANDVRALERRDTGGFHFEGMFPVISGMKLFPTVVFKTDDTYDNAQNRAAAEEKRDRERAAARNGDAPYVGEIFRGPTALSQEERKAQGIANDVMKGLRRQLSAGKAGGGSVDGGAPAEIRLEIRIRAYENP